MSALPVHMIEGHRDYKPVPFEARSGSLGWHGNALLVRKSVENIHKEIVHLPSQEPRGAVLAEVRVGGVEPLAIGLHLDQSGLWRRLQAAAITARTAARETGKPLRRGSRGEGGERAVGAGSI